MTRPKNVGVLLGSLRKDAISAGLARALQKLCPADLQLQQLTIGDMPFYNQDDEAQPPIPWKEFRKRILACDALLFITPEYNRSVPAVLKNAIDVGSRPYGQSVWSGKPAAVFTFSPGPLGGFGANQHLRQSLSCLNMPTMTNEVYLSSAGKLLNEHGAIATPDTQLFLKNVMESFASWIDRNGPAKV